MFSFEFTNLKLLLNFLLIFFDNLVELASILLMSGVDGVGDEW